MTTKEQLALPRGVRVFSEESRIKPHAVQWRVDGKRRSKFFTTIDARDKYTFKLLGDSKEIGDAAFRLSADDTRKWRAFMADIGTLDLNAVAACWRRYGKPAESALTVAAGADQFIAAKGAEGIGRLTLSHYTPVFRRFKVAFGPRNVNSLTRAEILGWLQSRKCDDYTRGRELGYIKAMFKWLRVPDNPCADIKKPKVRKKPISVMPVKDAEALMAANEKVSRELCGRLAAELFAGLRYSSAVRLTAADILFEERALILPAEKIKTEDREYIEGLPDNLWNWLKWSDPETWCMTERQYLEAKSKAFVRARIPHPRNVIRHSFCSYHVALYGNAARTAEILCHTNQRRLRRSYKGRAKESEGKAYFQINPIPQ